jgi:hypothetical protein
VDRGIVAVASPAYRKNDPHQLVFGKMYLQGVHPDEVLEEAMGYCVHIVRGNSGVAKENW